ncbi:unnamed protein product [Symbiodinium sp. CCMP2456]|nr:unnamed protein product [Symbiodinium sp. CCMP2456]
MPFASERHHTLPPSRSLVLCLLAVSAWILAPQMPFVSQPDTRLRSRGCESSKCRRDAWDDGIPDLPEEYRNIGPLRLGPRPRPFGLLLMPFVLYVYFMADAKRALFRKFDADGDKLLSPSELSAALGELPAGTFQAVDTDGTGAIDTKEWLFSFLHTDLPGS